MLLPTVQHFLQMQNIAPDERIVVGVSGGVDSIVLLHACFTLGQQIVVAHLDHQLRPASSADAKFVANYAKTLNVPFALKPLDIASAAKANNCSIETEGRNARYAFFAEVAASHQCKTVVVAHHADDQAETVLMRLIRGAGTSGLQGMQPIKQLDSGLTVLRPLLTIGKAEIRDYANALNLEWIEDESNQDDAYFRNRVRNTLLPSLKAENPNIVATLNRTARLLRLEHAILEEAHQTAWDSVATVEPEQITLNRQTFLELPVGLQLSVLRQATEQMQPIREEVTLATLEKVQSELPLLKNNKQLSLEGDAVIRRERDQFYVEALGSAIVAPHYPQLASTVPINVSLDTPVQSGNMQLTISSLLTTEIETNNEHHVVIDGDAIDADALVLRHPLPGDRFQPLGMGGKSQKLTALFSAKKIPANARRHWPVLASNNEIVWVCGLRLSENVRVTETTQSTYTLHLTLYSD